MILLVEISQTQLILWQRKWGMTKGSFSSASVNLIEMSVNSQSEKYQGHTSKLERMICSYLRLDLFYNKLRITSKLNIFFSKKYSPGELAQQLKNEKSKRRRGFERIVCDHKWQGYPIWHLLHEPWIGFLKYFGWGRKRWRKKESLLCGAISTSPFFEKKLVENPG